MKLFITAGNTQVAIDRVRCLTNIFTGRTGAGIALADVPLEDTAIAYQLGEHHQKERIDWSALPFETEPSSPYGLPITTTLSPSCGDVRSSDRGRTRFGGASILNRATSPSASTARTPLTG